jgi:hypothetical protein
MFFQSFLQDVRIGLRVLFKEKTFCFLAVAVLALGICGATTQFAIVNGAALRGFSFPNPEQLVSIGFVDPQTDPNQNNGGAGFVPSPGGLRGHSGRAAVVLDGRCLSE